MKQGVSALPSRHFPHEPEKVASWPISIAEASDRLGIPEHAAGVIVRALDIKTEPMPRNGKGLGRLSYRKLERAAVRAGFNVRKATD